MILNKIGIICHFNIDRLHNSYQDLKERITKTPSNEQELKELKLIIEENEVKMSQMKNEVDKIYEFILIMEKYFYPFEKENTESFWFLKKWPLDIRDGIRKGKNSVT